MVRIDSQPFSDGGTARLTKIASGKKGGDRLSSWKLANLEKMNNCRQQPTPTNNSVNEVQPLPNVTRLPENGRAIIHDNRFFHNLPVLVVVRCAVEEADELVEAVMDWIVLVLKTAVPLPKQGSRVAVVLEHARESWDRGRYPALRFPATNDYVNNPYALLVPASEECGTRRAADRGVGVKVGEEDPWPSVRCAMSLPSRHTGPYRSSPGRRPE